MAVEPAEFHRRATEGFGANVERVRDDQWTGSTPCTEWDVLTLVRHLVYEQLWVRPLLEGQTIQQVGDRFEGDILGEDPKEAWSEAARDALDAVARAGTMEGDVHLSYGDRPGSEYVNEVATDLLIHGWDLARGIGVGETMDDELVEHVLGQVEPNAAGLRATGLFGPDVTPPEGADRQTRLLAIFGRVA
jgi:uncharacterized protein (TIGR03086 family)